MADSTVFFFFAIVCKCKLAKIISGWRYHSGVKLFQQVLVSSTSMIAKLSKTSRGHRRT